jgi:uncharacterized membrane protein YhaH (DUF805 family)
MKALAYRTNRATYAVSLVMFVAIVAILINTLGKPGPTEVIAAFIVIPRLHDIGRSGWWYAPLIIGEIIVAVIGYQALGSTDGVLIAGGLYLIVVMALFAILALIPGQPNANKWGYPPPPGISWKRRASDEQRLEEIF